MYIEIDIVVKEISGHINNPSLFKKDSYSETIDFSPINRIPNWSIALKKTHQTTLLYAVVENLYHERS